MQVSTHALWALSVLAALGQALPVAAQDKPPPCTPFMVSFVTPLQGPPSDFDVKGLRINLVYGECRNFSGLDLGGAGRSTGSSAGVHIALLATVSDGDAAGLQIGTANYVKGAFKGLQVGVSSYAANARGAQVGVFNGAGHLSGMQLGLINVTRTMIGFQVGLVNVIRDNDVPFLPLINGYF